MFQTRAGFPSLLKDGARQYAGQEEALLRNIDACKSLAAVVRTSLGPNSMSKLLETHIGKLFWTSDASTIVEQMEVQHPAAKMLAMASQMQQQEFGDGTNLTVAFAGELLMHAETLLRDGLHVTDIVGGYELASSRAAAVLESLALKQQAQLQSSDAYLRNAVTTAVSTKALRQEQLLAGLIVEACAFVGAAAGDKKPINLDNVRVAKLVGGSLDQAKLINGMVVLRDCAGFVKSKQNCKVAVLGCGLEHSATEAKGTVLLHGADELLSYTSGEEKRMENVIQNMADAGIGAIIVGGNIADIALHFCNKMDIAVLKCTSKFELQRLARTLNAATLIKLQCPSPEECGFVESLESLEIASKAVTIVKNGDSRVATILLRGATNSLLDEVERTVEDGVRCVRNIQIDGRLVPGAGSAELAVSQDLARWAAKLEGLQQYAAAKFAEALEVVPRTLAENAGFFGCEVVASMHAALAHGKSNLGVNVKGTSVENAICDAVNVGILDHLSTKRSALRLAADAALTVLRVDQIIMARPAGGPKAPQRQGDWDQD